jgi:hypothetical protein
MEGVARSVCRGGRTPPRRSRANRCASMSTAGKTTHPPRTARPARAQRNTMQKSGCPASHSSHPRPRGRRSSRCPRTAARVAAAAEARRGRCARTHAMHSNNATCMNMTRAWLCCRPGPDTAQQHPAQRLRQRPRSGLQRVAGVQDMQQPCCLMFYKSDISNTAAGSKRVRGSSGRSTPTRVLCCISRRRHATADAAQRVRFHDSRRINVIKNALVQARRPIHRSPRRSRPPSVVALVQPLSPCCRSLRLAAFRSTRV